MRNNLTIRVKKEDFIRKLGIKDGRDAVIDYTKITKDILGQLPKPRDGKDATVDEAKLIKKIVKEVLKRVPEQDTMNQVGYASGGANQIVYQGGGVRLSDYVQYLNFGAGLSASYSNGTILVVAQTSGSILTATGTIDDSNLAFTFTSEPSVLIINGGTYKQTGGSITWTWTAATLTATLSVPVGTNGSIFGLL